MTQNTVSMIKYGLGVGIGLLLMGWALQAFLWTGYAKANPAYQSVSTSTGFVPFWTAIFVIGTIITYVYFMEGLDDIINE